MRKVSTTEALMTDPTTPEGVAYWRQRRESEEQAEQTDMDLIVGHPFRPHPLQPEVCGYQRRDGYACGYGLAEHADQVEE